MWLQQTSVTMATNHVHPMTVFPGLRQHQSSTTRLSHVKEAPCGTKQQVLTFLDGVAGSVTMETCPSEASLEELTEDFDQVHITGATYGTQTTENNNKVIGLRPG